MSPRHAVHLLGLCNLVAGALVAVTPALLMPGMSGLGTTAANLLGASLGIVVAAVGLGAWLMPPGAVRPYLWIFGVAVKVAAAAVWAVTAVSASVGTLAVGTVLDLVVAGVIALGLIRRSLRAPGGA